MSEELLKEIAYRYHRDPGLGVMDILREAYEAGRKANIEENQAWLAHVLAEAGRNYDRGFQDAKEAYLKGVLSE